MLFYKYVNFIIDVRVIIFFSSFFSHKRSQVDEVEKLRKNREERREKQNQERERRNNQSDPSNVHWEFSDMIEDYRYVLLLCLKSTLCIEIFTVMNVLSIVLHVICYCSLN